MESRLLPSTLWILKISLRQPLFMLIDRASEGRNTESFDRNACILNRFSLVDMNTGDDYSIFTAILIDMKQKMTSNVKSQKSHI